MRFPGGSSVLPALLALVVHAGAAAQQVPSPYRYVERGQAANAFVGWLDGERGRFDLGPGPGVLFGGRYGLELSGPLALEGVASFVPTQRYVVNPRRPEGQQLVGEADVKLLMVDARLRFTFTGRRTWNGISPYVVGGAGFAIDVEGDQREDLLVEEADRFDFGTEFTGTFGAGFRWIPVEHLSVRADAWLSLYQVDVPDGYEDPELGLVNVPASEWVNSPVLAIGVSWLF